jgi:phosphomannomutase
MGCVFLEEFFKHIPADLVKMNFELDGTFPSHEPNPLKYKNLKDLRDKVVAEHADLGIAPDGDGDRIFFIDEKGSVIQATSITSLIANEILEKSPGETITADIRDIFNVKEVCRRLGGKFTMCIVGHAYITEQLNREGAAFAGESSGHFFFRETGGGESSIWVILYVLQAMSKQDKPISQIISQYITAYEHEEVNFVISPPLDPRVIIEDLQTMHADGRVYKDDGLSVDYPDWRFNVRLSNTENEPILRVNVEGKNKELVDLKFAEIEQKILAFGGIHQ